MVSSNEKLTPQVMAELSIATLNALIFTYETARLGLSTSNTIITTHTHPVRDVVQTAVETGSCIRMAIPEISPNVVVVDNADLYPALLAIGANQVVERFNRNKDEALEYAQHTLIEELSHLAPALEDPGMERYVLGIRFTADNKGLISWGGLMGVEGNLQIQTVVDMYKANGNASSPQDLAMINMLSELGLT